MSLAQKSPEEPRTAQKSPEQPRTAQNQREPTGPRVQMQPVATSQSILKPRSTLNGSEVVGVTSWINIIWGIGALQTSVTTLHLAEISCFQVGE